MSRPAMDDNKPMTLWGRLDQRAMLMRAEAPNKSGLSAQDSLRVLDLLENPRPANAKLRTAAMALPK